MTNNNIRNRMELSKILCANKKKFEKIVNVKFCPVNRCIEQELVKN